MDHKEIGSQRNETRGKNRREGKKMKEIFRLCSFKHLNFGYDRLSTIWEAYMGVYAFISNIL